VGERTDMTVEAMAAALDWLKAEGHYERYVASPDGIVRTSPPAGKPKAPIRDAGWLRGAWTAIRSGVAASIPPSRWRSTALPVAVA
jgi:hypothetical protein